MRLWQPAGDTGGMIDAPTKPTLTLVPGAALKTAGDIAAFYKRLTGRDMTEEGRRYAREKLGQPKPDEPEA